MKQFLVHKFSLQKTTHLIGFVIFSLLGLSSTLIMGCSHTLDLQQLTALEIDCETENIKISDNRADLNGEENWTAQCDDRIYSCTYMNGLDLACYQDKK